MTSTATLNPVLRNFWETPARNRVLYGGRSSSKSWDAAGFVVFLAQKYKIRVACTRQFQNRIADSVYAVLKIRIIEFGLEKEFEFREASIRHKITGSEFLFFGIARNLSEIKSLESIDIMWHEECQLLTEEQWKLIEPTLRKEGSQHWFVFNPRFVNDFIYQRFIVNPPPDTISRLINYEENPFLSSTILKVIQAAKAEDVDSYNHIYCGMPLTDDARVIIKRSWVEAAINAHLKLGIEPLGASKMGFDVADDGDDKCANIHTKGFLATWSDEWAAGEDEILKSCSRTYQAAMAREASIRYDSIGVGASCGGKFDELNKEHMKRVKYSKFNAGAGVHNPEGYYTIDRMDKIKNEDYFSNLKSQTWWLVADRFRNTYDAVMRGKVYPQDELISIDDKMPNLNKLITELSTPMRDFDANGRVKVEAKKDLVKRNIKSPNLADAFVMCFAPDEHAQIKVSQGAINQAIGNRRR